MQPEQGEIVSLVNNLQETYAKLQHELSLAEEKLRKAQQQGKLVEGERKVLDKGIAKANNSIKVGKPHILTPHASSRDTLCSIKVA